MAHTHAWKALKSAAIGADGTRYRTRRCRCGEYQTRGRKPRKGVGFGPAPKAARNA